MVDALTRRVNVAEPSMTLVGDDTLHPRFQQASNIKAADNNASDDIESGDGDTDSDDADRAPSTGDTGRDTQGAYLSNDANTQSADDNTDEAKAARGRSALGRFHNSLDPSRVARAHDDGTGSYAGDGTGFDQAQHVTPHGDAQHSAQTAAQSRVTSQGTELPDSVSEAASQAKPPKPRTL